MFHQLVIFIVIARNCNPNNHNAPGQLKPVSGTKLLEGFFFVLPWANTKSNKQMVSSLYFNLKLKKVFFFFECIQLWFKSKCMNTL